MRSVVVDASVLVKVYVNEKDSERALQIVERDDLNLEAPDVLASEVINTLIKYERTEVLSTILVDRAVRDLLLLLSRLAPSVALLDRAIEIARAIRHPLYDCMYLTLAERLGVDLVTADVAFAERCRSRSPTHARQVVLLSEFSP